jgi:hypothetical protein
VFGPSLALSALVCRSRASLRSEIAHAAQDLQRKIVAEGCYRGSYTNPPSPQPSRELARAYQRYHDLLSGELDRITADLLRRGLPFSIARARLLLSKKRTNAEQLDYQRLAVFVLGCAQLDKASLRRVLRCHPRTIDRLIRYAASDLNMEESNVVDITTARRIARMEQTLSETHALIADIALRLKERWPTNAEVANAVDEFVAEALEPLSA